MGNYTQYKEEIEEEGGVRQNYLYQRMCSCSLGDLPQVGIPIVTLRFEYFGFAWTPGSVLVMAEIFYMPGQSGQNCEGDDEPGLTRA